MKHPALQSAMPPIAVSWVVAYGWTGEILTWNDLAVSDDDFLHVEASDCPSSP